MIDVAGLVRGLLEETQLSQSEVSRRLGVVSGAVSHWVNGHRRCRIDTLERLGDVCGYDVEIRFVRRTGYGHDRTVMTLTEPDYGQRWVDAFNRPWVRTSEGWAPTVGNPLRIRLPWHTLIGLYGRVTGTRES